jgi:hypothetical protein
VGDSQPAAGPDNPAMMRRIFIDWPAQIVDLAWFGYWLLIAAGSIVCLVTAALWALLFLAGYRLP